MTIVLIMQNSCELNKTIMNIGESPKREILCVWGEGGAYSKHFFPRFPGSSYKR